MYKLQHMNALLFYLGLPFLYLISALPNRLFYALSNCLFFFFFHVSNYRRKVVQSNLRNAFPEKSEIERKHIEKKFYKYLCDLILESFRSLTKGESFFKTHCIFSDSAKKLFDHYASTDQSVILVMGHFGNWEWAGQSFSLNCRQKLFVIYRPLSNYYFNKLTNKMRSKFGTGLIEMKDAYKTMWSNKHLLTATAFIADQTPPPENAYWTLFMNQQTPVFWGTELLSKRLNFPIIYATVKRIKRGFYQIEAETLLEKPQMTAEGEISESHTRKLETEIKNQPELWLWSHRRWKHKPPSTFNKL